MKFLAAIAVAGAQLQNLSCESNCANRDVKGSLTYNVCVSNCHHLMQLSAANIQEDFKLPKAMKDAVTKAKGALGMKELNAKKHATKKAAVMKTLDQLINDYGMEGEISAIDMNRPVPFNGMGAYGSESVFEAPMGEWPYGMEGVYGYGAAPAAFASPEFMW